MKKYIVASAEGAARYGAEEGAQVSLDLPAEEELAVVAAGWLEHDKPAAKESAKEAKP